jgi:hypothetical protein
MELTNQSKRLLKTKNTCSEDTLSKKKPASFEREAGDAFQVIVLAPL